MRAALWFTQALFAAPALAAPCARPLEMRITHNVDPVPYTQGQGTSFNYKQPHSAPHVLSFPQVVPEDEVWFVHDLYFHDTHFAGTQPSYAVLYWVMTLTSTSPRLQLKIPVKLNPGFTLTGQFSNGSGQWQWMTFGLNICRHKLTGAP